MLLGGKEGEEECVLQAGREGWCWAQVPKPQACWKHQALEGFLQTNQSEQNRGVTGAKQAATLQRNPVPRGHDSWELKKKPNPTSKGSKRAQCIPEKHASM